MSEILARFKASDAWDRRFGLPLFPAFNNPWIYGAYALKIMRAHDLTASEDVGLVQRFEEHADACRVQNGIVPGIFDRWPGGDGGVFSHDEIMGMAYISPTLAEEILNYLEANDGVYCNKPEEISDPSYADKYNVYRMLYLKPFLQAATEKRRVGFASQLQWSAEILRDAIAFKRGNFSDAGGRARIWIMLEHMSEHSISGLGALAWKTAMHVKGCTLRDMLAREPGSAYPFIADLAPDDF